MNIKIFFLILFITINSYAKEWYAPTTYGFEFGPSLDLLAADLATNTFGLGLGSQWGLTAAGEEKLPYAIKLRFEKVSLREENLNKTPSNALIGNTTLKALEQYWWLFHVGIEGRIEAQGQRLFWEATTGYSVGQNTRAQLRSNLLDGNLIDYSLTTRSFLFLGGGIGMRRNVYGVETVCSARTFFILNSIYTGTYQEQAFIPIPLLFSVGIEKTF